jgi:hypothetical protein
MFFAERFYASLLFTGALTAIPMWGVVSWGAHADGSARQVEIICRTCPNPVINLSNRKNGGNGRAAAPDWALS